MSSTGANSQQQSGVVAALLVFIGCAVVSCIAWYPLGGPIYGLNLMFRGFGCATVTPGSVKMFFCSAAVGLLQILFPAIVMIIILMMRKRFMRWVQKITPRLPQGIQFLVAPAVATCIFTILWAGVHYTLPIEVGLLPQIIFPAVIGLFTFIVIRYGGNLQRTLDPFFKSRDRIPRWLRFAGVIAIPFLLSILITQPWRQIVSAGPQLQHFIVLVGLVVAFLLLTPRAGVPAPVPISHNTGRGKQAGIQRRGVVRLVLGGAGHFVCRLAMALGMAAAVHAVLDLYTTELALAHNCSPENPLDCQNTGGFNTTTATGGGVIGAGAVVTGATIVRGEGGETTTDGFAPVPDPTGGGRDLGGGDVPTEPITNIIGGRDALQWLRSRGFIDGTGRLTDRYRTWYNTIGGGSDLEAIAVNVDENGRVTEDTAIVIQETPIHIQDINDSCAIASTRIANQRLTGNDVPEVDLRNQSQGHATGYRQNPANFGTSVDGQVRLADDQPNLDAHSGNLSLPDMQREIENGNEVTISYRLPGGGGHRVVVHNVQAQPGGTALIEIDDPWDGSRRWVDDRWWTANGNQNSTIVIEPRGDAAPPVIPP